MRWGENIITEKGGTVIDKSQVACPAPESLTCPTLYAIVIANNLH